MKTAKQIEAEYRDFIKPDSRCWRCGRGPYNVPPWWYSEWRIDPHHFVSHPRRNDRRAVVSLCRRCHDVQHLGPFAADPDKYDKLDLPTMLAIKKFVDPEFYDRKFLLTCIEGVYLPPAVSYLRVVELSWAVRQVRR